MRVVEYGHIKPFYAFCHGCGAILEFSKTEARMSNISLQRGPQRDGKDYVVYCPVCRRAIYEKEWKETVEEC
jgi:hypothetical protein